MMPMVAVLSAGSTTAARNAERGAESIDCVHDRRIKNVMAPYTELGIGIRASMTADGRCVNTIVCFLVRHKNRLDPVQR